MSDIRFSVGFEVHTVKALLPVQLILPDDTELETFLPGAAAQNHPVSLKTQLSDQSVQTLEI